MNDSKNFHDYRGLDKEDPHLMAKAKGLAVDLDVES